MGEVYRASDPRLGRQVAVKVLPSGYAEDPEALERFEREARAAGSLSHPGLLTIFDFGTHAGAPYLVSELLDGETLRMHLERGRVPIPRALDFGVQISRALAVAHGKGIVHRDLKPENLFVTRDGRIKILDFGLAKLMRPDAVAGSRDDTATMTASLTESGALLGTVGYMSPEQARGERTDPRTDLFALGAILYEMLSGEHAFGGKSPVDRLSAILNQEPPALSRPGSSIPPLLDRIVHHCLEKNPEDRFHSAHDVAFALQDLSEAGEEVTLGARASARRHWLLPAAGLTVLVALAAGLMVGRRLASTPPPSFHRLTYQRGVVPAARFTPDGHGIVYSAGWEGEPLRLFSTRAESPESSPIDLPSANLLAISSTGMMALTLRPAAQPPVITFRGTLAQSPLAGGAPREMLEKVTFADWSPDGTQLAVVRDFDMDGGKRDKNRIEFPPGTVLYESSGWLSHVRVSPRRDGVAFVDHSPGVDRGTVMATLDGHTRRLTDEWGSIEGLAWTADGREIWFSAAREGNARDIWSVSRSGKIRLVMRMAGGLTLQDISREGRVLLARDYHRDGILGAAPGETHERELSWLDYSMSADLSLDGRTVLFGEGGENAGPDGAACLRKMDGSPVVRLGDGLTTGLSPDGLWAVSCLHAPKPHLVLLPTGAGEPRALDPGPLTSISWASWFRDSQRLLFTGIEPGHQRRVYIQNIGGGAPRPATGEGVESNYITSDGRFVISGDSLYPVGGGEPIKARGLEPGDVPARISDDDGVLLVWRFRSLPVPIYEVDLRTGRRSLLRELMPSDPAGIIGLGPVQCTPGARAYVYTYTRYLSDLYLVTGLR
jgi:hypothetical protein